MAEKKEAAMTMGGVSCNKSKMPQHASIGCSSNHLPMFFWRASKSCLQAVSQMDICIYKGCMKHLMCHVRLSLTVILPIAELLSTFACDIFLS